ncbi:MAG: 2-dehydropantoate 2-reductase [Deltaproteobacteria bacterium]|nr:2-dehydropantoate 2-reductase [Deltaproteobacteria bacterium]
MSADQPTAPAMPRILVASAGAVGGVVAAGLIELGVPVTLLTGSPLVADAIGARGLLVRGEPGRSAVRAQALIALATGGTPFDYVLLCGRAREAEAAAAQVRPALAEQGILVCLQDAPCEERIASVSGGAAVAGAVVGWTAHTIEPGIYERTSAGGFVLGPLDAGADEARLAALARLLETVGPVRLTRNLRGARWSKLALACAAGALCGIGDGRLGQILRHGEARALALDLLAEAVEVARGEGVELDPVPGTVDVSSLAPSEAERRAAPGAPGLAAKDELLRALALRFRPIRSRLDLSALAGGAREVDFLNGEVVARARALGLRAPANEAVQKAVHRIAEGKARPGLELLRRIYEA